MLSNNYYLLPLQCLQIMPLLLTLLREREVKSVSEKRLNMAIHEMASKLTEVIVAKKDRRVCDRVKANIREGLETAANDNEGAISTRHLEIAAEYADVDSKLH